MIIRPMRHADVVGAEGVTDEAFHALPGVPPDTPPERRGPVRGERWRRRADHLLQHDAGGCWVAEVEGDVVGVALALRREGLWALSSYGVLPRLQGEGIGKALLEAAIGHGAGCLRGIICSSHDPRAARRYRGAGFTLHPAMALVGTVDRDVLPVVDGVREGSATDIDFCDSVDRQVRGAGHGPDHEHLLTRATLLVCDRLTGSGYCFVEADGAPALLAATTRRVASRLLWEALARSPGGAAISFGDVTAEQEWAVDIALAAGLAVYNEGYLCLRHMRPPAPYLPSAQFC